MCNYMPYNLYMDVPNDIFYSVDFSNDENDEVQLQELFMVILYCKLPVIY